MLRRVPLLPFGHRPAAAITVAVAVVVAVLAAAMAGGSPAFAHNSLEASDPADGAVVAAAPAAITFDFAAAVPLETLTVTVIDAAGIRSELSGSTHGPAGESQVVTPLPQLSPGSTSVRWRLVSPDGHPITGRVEFTIEGAASMTVPQVAPAVPSSSAPASGAPASGATRVPVDPATSDPSAAPADAAVDAGDGLGYSTPSAIRFVLRFTSYLAIMTALGVLLVSATVWPGAGSHPVLRRVTSLSLIGVAALSLPQLLIVASDVSGEAPWSSFGSVSAATTTDAGMAFVLRIVLAAALWIVMCRSSIRSSEVFWTAAALPALGLLGTWAFAGHSRSMRWPAVGVSTDVVHHGAAALWIAGLAIVGFIAIPSLASRELVRTMQRFSVVAAWSVAILVGTGLVQAVRLVGGWGALFDGQHGRYLVAKLVALAAMLALANANRRRVDGRLSGNDDDRTRDVSILRRAVGAEFALGLVIIALTAAMVVAPPATSDTDPAVVVAEP